MHGYSSVGLETSRICDTVLCEFAVVGVADHSVCSLSGSVDNTSFTQATSPAGIIIHPDRIEVNFISADVLMQPLGQNESFTVQVTCGQGVVAAQ